TFGGRKLSILSQQRKIFTFSSAVLIIGIISLFVFKLNPGIDFTRGSRIEVLADQAISVEEIEEKLEQLDLEPQSVLLSGEDNEIAITRYDTILTKEEIAEISDFFVEEYGHEPSVSVVSPIVGEKLVKDAIYALAIAAVGMIIYVTFRFEFYFGITAILTLLHDVFFMLVILSITRIEFDVTIVAAILTIVGYSINNTIVIFDRIRENIQLEGVVSSYDKLSKIVNRSLVQSLTRSINTMITTMIAVLAFLILG